MVRYCFGFMDGFQWRTIYKNLFNNAINKIKCYKKGLSLSPHMQKKYNKLDHDMKDIKVSIKTGKRVSRLMVSLSNTQQEINQ